MLLPIHIAVGGIAIILGAIALSVRKGGMLHRRSGLLFVGAMLVMGATASTLGFRKSPTDPNVVAGLLTGYFVITAWTTVRRPTAWTRALTIGGMIVACALGLADIARGVEAFQTPRRALHGVPFFMFFFLGTVLLLAAAGDFRALRAGVLRGSRRLRRHLWRMCFALFIAAGSFFSIRARVAKVLPEPFTTAPMRALPIVLLFGAMFYWLWRLRGARTTPRLVVRDEPAGS